MEGNALTLGRRRSAREVGAEIKRRRGKMGPADLAKKIGCPSNYIWSWEKGQYKPRGIWLSKLVAALECSHSGLLLNDAETSGRVESATAIGNAFWKEISQLHDGALDRTSFQNARQIIVRSDARKILTICGTFLEQCQHARSGREFSALSSEMDVCIDLATHCYEHRRAQYAGTAAQVLYDAVDKRVHWRTFLVRRDRLGAATGFDFGQLALIATDNLADRARLRKLCGRRGDFYKIVGGGNAVVNELARNSLLNGIEGRGRRFWSCAGYHVVRSVCIAAARSNVSDAEFEAMVALAEEALQSGMFTAHEEAHILEGIAEAFAIRSGSKSARRKRYEECSKDFWQRAERQSRWATLEHGEHPEFGLRVMKLPLTLAQWGIMEPFTSYGMSARGRMRDLAEAVRQRAADDGNDRVEEDMKKEVRNLDVA